MKYYKYTVVNDPFRNTEDIICRSRIRLNSPDEFNDPFDLNILPRVDLHEDDLRAWMEHQEKTIPLTDQQKELISEFKKQNGNIKSPVFLSGLIAGALKQGVRTHGIYCLSVIWDSILMWSIYANKHKGICIRFNIDEKSKVWNYLNPVKYSFDYPQIYINDEKQLDDLFTTKYAVWNNELEARIIKPHGCGEKIELDQQEIDAIIIGINTSIEDIDTVLGWIKNNNRKIKIFKAMMTLRDYKIDIMPIDISESINGEFIYNQQNFDNLLYALKKLRA